MTSDFSTRLRIGRLVYLFGNFSSVRDPYFVCGSHQRFVYPTDQPSDMPWRWANDEYSQLVDQMGQTPSDAPEMADLYRRADIWLKSCPRFHLCSGPTGFHTTRPTGPTANGVEPLYQQCLLEPDVLLVLLNLEPTS